MDTLDAELLATFEQLRKDLAGARARNRQRDDYNSRAAVDACQTKLNAVLDMYLELEHAASASKQQPA